MEEREERKKESGWFTLTTIFRFRWFSFFFFYWVTKKVPPLVFHFVLCIRIKTKGPNHTKKRRIIREGPDHWKSDVHTRGWPIIGRTSKTGIVNIFQKGGGGVLLHEILLPSFQRWNSPLGSIRRTGDERLFTFDFLKISSRSLSSSRVVLSKRGIVDSFLSQIKARSKFDTRGDRNIFGFCKHGNYFYSLRNRR